MSQANHIRHTPSLEPERWAALAAEANTTLPGFCVSVPAAELRQLLDHSRALPTAEGRATDLQGELAAARQQHKVEVLDILRDLRLPRLPLPPEENSEGELNWEHNLICGQNKERQAINDYCRQRAYEYDPQGIGPDPTKPGQWDTRPTAAAPTLVGDETPAERICDECGNEYLANCLTCRAEVGEPEVVLTLNRPAPADSQLPFNPGFVPKCHGCGLDSHAKRCKTEGCPAKKASAASPVVEKGPPGAGREVACG